MLTDEELEQLYYADESGIHGTGLYARKRIRKGSYMGEYDGPEVTDNGSHVLWVEEDDGEWIGRDGQNLLRYLNHSKKPQAEFVGFKLYAMRDIEPDEEITIDYGEEP
ncbi:MAG TPA: SET domain-containing protein [Gammaproteobacteria bacterium]|nr:SET domain-containing protein [Gammaproteobacteria bacterium]